MTSLKLNLARSPFEIFVTPSKGLTHQTETLQRGPDAGPAVGEVLHQQVSSSAEVRCAGRHDGASLYFAEAAIKREAAFSRRRPAE